MTETMDTYETIRAKWTMDEAETLLEAAEKLRVYANDLEKMHNEGWRLREPIADDYGHIYKET